MNPMLCYGTENCVKSSTDTWANWTTPSPSDPVDSYQHLLGK